MIDTKNVRDNLFHHSLYNLEFLVSVENLFSWICIFGNTSSKLQISDKIEIYSTLTKLQFKYQLILFYFCILCTHALNSWIWVVNHHVSPYIDHVRVLSLIIFLAIASTKIVLRWVIQDYQVNICTSLGVRRTQCRIYLTYRLDRLKPRASKFRGPPAKVCIIFNSVIEISHLCCHNVLYFLNKSPSVIFITQFSLNIFLFAKYNK